MLRIASLCFVAVLAVSGCGDDGAAANDASVPSFSDSGTPDARPRPDAPPCTGTVCDGLCVDTSSDPMHCGGCDMACDSPGQICSGEPPCACPANFVPATVQPTGFDQMLVQGDLYAAVAPLLSGTTFNALVVAYELDTELGVAHDLAESVASVTPPAVGAGYDVDTNTFVPHTPYAAIEGTIVFDTRCAVGASGTISGALLAEVSLEGGTVDPQVVEGGCQLAVESLSFSIGDACPPEGGDAGPMDAGPMDGGSAP